MQRKRFSLVAAGDQDHDWLRQTMDRECRKLQAQIVGSPDDTLLLQW